MIKYNERKNRFLSLFFYKYFGILIRRYFFRVNIKGQDELRSAILKSRQQNIPIIFCVNHSNWWDAALICWLTDFFKLDAHCIMEEKQMQKHGFFNKIGAIPIVREDARKSLSTLNFAYSLIKNTNKALWIFPQGKISPNENLPLKFFTGVAFLIEKLQNAILINVHLEYRFTSEQRPEIFINFFGTEFFNSNSNLRRKDFTSELEKKFEIEIVLFREKFAKSQFKDYKEILKGKISADKK